MSMAANLVMNVLGKQILQNGLSASGLGSLLAGQKSWLSGLLPAGVSDVPGLHGLADYASQASGAARDVAQAGGRAVRGAAQEVYRSGVGAAQQVKPWASALVPLVLLALAVAALPWLIRALTTKELPVAKGPEVKTPNLKDIETHVAGYGPDLSKLTNIKLPDGVSLQVPENSFLHSIYTFLSGPGDTKSSSFVFEKLTFDGGSIKTTPETETAVKTLGTLATAFPDVQIRIVGYTDNVGDADTNRRLSLDRANALKELLVKVGVPANRISTEGHGGEKPIAPNDTEENREKNRRVELSFVKK
jgi:outer membrane protein OmpA-like peptidoglycan-associated protein